MKTSDFKRGDKVRYADQTTIRWGKKRVAIKTTPCEGVVERVGTKYVYVMLPGRLDKALPGELTKALG